MIRILTLLLCFLSLLTAKAQEPVLAARQSFMLRVNGVPKVEQEQINGIYTIGEQGTVILPILKNPLPMTGLKVSEAEAQIEEAYRAAGLSKPHVSMIAGGSIPERKIKAGEKLTLRFSGIPKEDLVKWNGAVTINDSGEIRLPYLSSMKVTDCSPQELSAKIAKAYRDAEIWSDLVVTVLRAGDPPNDRDVIIVGGEVEEPNEMKFRENLTLSEAIRHCGGPTEYSNLSKVKLNRGKSDSLHDLSAPKDRSDPSLQPGDQIVVMENGYFPRVEVSGEVNAPGKFELKPKLTLLAAIAISGGVKAGSDLSKVVLLRNKLETTFDLRKATKDTGPVLQSGDRIIVPSLEKSPTVVAPTIKVSGGVRQPGEVRFRPGMTIYAAITLCGGSPDDNVRRIKLIRDKTERIIDLRKVAETQDLQPGDKIVVPEG